MEKEPRLPPKVKKAINKSVLTLQHASICREANCRVLPTCTTMKRIIEHSKICCRIGKTDCLACRALVSLSYDHSKGCLEIRCVVPYCNIIKMQLLRCQLYEVHTTSFKERLMSICIKFFASQPRPQPHANQPQRQATRDPNQVLQQSSEELQLPPLKTSLEFNQPLQQASPDLNYPPQQASPLFYLQPRQEVWSESALHRWVCYRRVNRAEPLQAEPDAQNPMAEAGVGIILKTGIGPVPRRIRIKKSTYLWISRMLFEC